MPFTLAHAAAVPPLWRLTMGRLVVSALVVGSMSPDFEYLVRLSPQRTIGHTPLGVVVLCLPASLAVLGVWHRLVGPAFARLLPGGCATAAARPFRFGPLPRFLLVCASAGLGAFSHIAWDSFTNQRGAMVQRFDVLARPAWDGGLPLYALAWYGSSAVGLLVVGWWLTRLARQPGQTLGSGQGQTTRRLRRWTSAALACGAASLAATNAVRHAAVGASPHQVLVAGVLGAMAGTALAAVTTGTLLRARLAR